MITFHTEKRKLSQLVGYPLNPRIISAEQREQLKKSIEKFGVAAIPVINTDNTIVSGHQRIAVMREVFGEEKEIEVRVPDTTLSEEDFKELLVRMNADSGEWDYEILKAEFQQDALESYGFENVAILFEEPEREVDVWDKAQKKADYENNELRKIILLYQPDQQAQLKEKLSEYRKELNLKNDAQAILHRLGIPSDNVDYSSFEE